MTAAPPILFCHYGDSRYLRYTLACAQRNNPDKRVYLLGDERNERIAAGAGVAHRHLGDYRCGPLLDEFNEVYHEVRGRENTYDSFWMKFVFERWFLVGVFIQERGFSRFWHFDSDTMIVDRLSRHEAKFEGYDCTEQCGGGCMNGFIVNPQVLLNYLRFINELFRRTDYLKQKQREFNRDHPNRAFTEMTAYETYRDEFGVKSVRLGRPVDGSMFDDYICGEQGVEMERLKTRHRIKKVYLNPDGRFFCRDKKSLEWIQMNSLNLSWVPLCTFRNVLSHSDRGREGELVAPEIAAMRCLSEMPMPVSQVVKYQLRIRTRKIRYWLKDRFKALRRRAAGG